MLNHVSAHTSGCAVNVFQAWEGAPVEEAIPAHAPLRTVVDCTVNAAEPVQPDRSPDSNPLAKTVAPEAGAVNVERVVKLTAAMSRGRLLSRENDFFPPLSWAAPQGPSPRAHPPAGSS